MIMGKRLDQCGICGGSVKELLTFPEFPFAGRFTKKIREQPKYIADLSLGMCNKCNHVQLITIIEPDFLYAKGYTYRTSKNFLTDSNQKVFLEFIKQIWTEESPSVLDIGCNDLSLLNVMSDYVCYRIGVDPMQNDFINNDKKIEVHGKFIEEINWNDFQVKPNLIISRHNIEHIFDTSTFFNILWNKVEKSTLLVFEFPDAEAMVNNLRYDQIFHQHIHYFTRDSFTQLINLHGFEVVASKYNGKMWGGSWIIAFRKGNETTPRTILSDKLIMGNYEQFKSKNASIDDYLVKYSDVYGYGAGQMTPVFAYHLPSKLNSIESIIDDDPEKDGKYFDYIKPKIINSSQIDLVSETVFITSVDATATIVKNITARKIILPNILFTM